VTDRYRVPGGWTVEVVHLTGTPDRHDGEWLRNRYHGYYVKDVRGVADLEQWFPAGRSGARRISVGRLRRFRLGHA
jgi:hypothetical protein